MEKPKIAGTLTKTKLVSRSVATESYKFDWVVKPDDLRRLLANAPRQASGQQQLPKNDEDIDVHGSNENENGNPTPNVQPKVWLPSPSVRLGEHIGCTTEWCAQMTTVIGEKGIPHISLYLWLLNFLDEKEGTGSTVGAGDGDEYVDVVYKLELYESNRFIMSKSSSIRRFKCSDEDCIWGWSQFCPVLDLTSPIAAVGPLTVRINLLLLQRSCGSSPSDLDGKFLSDCNADERPETCLHKRSEEDMDMNTEDSQPSKKTKTGDDNNTAPLDSTAKFRTMIANLWENKNGWDVEMKCGDKIFKTHASILSARSPFFARKFESTPVGQKKSFTVDPEANPEVLEALLEHCYTGVVNISKIFDKYLDLYILAFNFEMRVLKDTVFRDITTGEWMNFPYYATKVLVLAKEYPPDLSSMRNLANFVAENLDQLQREPYFVEFRNNDIQENDGEFFTRLLFEA